MGLFTNINLRLNPLNNFINFAIFCAFQPKVEVNLCKNKEDLKVVWFKEIIQKVQFSEK